tara:strand:- start:76601 stop:77002 length:402 start_codon:yes stop_codon:yes gene_type:complete
MEDPGQIVTLMDYQQFCDQRSGYEFSALIGRGDPCLQVGHELVYNSLGLAGEAGEFVEKIKKAIRMANIDSFYGTIDDEKRLACLKELGDVMYYVSRCANLLDSSLEEVAEIHKVKLLDRIERGVVKGEGDDR